MRSSRHLSPNSSWRSSRPVTSTTKSSLAPSSLISQRGRLIKYSFSSHSTSYRRCSFTFARRTWRSLITRYGRSTMLCTTSSRRTKHSKQSSHTVLTSLKISAITSSVRRGINSLTHSHSLQLCCSRYIISLEYISSHTLTMII